ncbi:hypothetical protein HYH03_002234 [Edaphochlamys debaryana]|uniref:Long-chain-fatty-acid--CoA ligase n=1 Tax=Edaphochlamys debaryana TaxID=47281 RepID=A0A835YDX9_9CHLO|nr:hypothetical protein HYH03_002234 [Edaphochlamys debaryana]|eukprot:KAG2499949.1 hypothetical protein HYH03_002234 [Edaphochlamys debaryana]
MQSAKFSLLAEMEPARQAANGNHLSPVWRPIGAKDGFPKLAGIETCYDSFEKSVKEYADCPCLGDREVGPDGHAGPFVFHNFREVGDEVSAVGSAYAALGLKAGDRIGVLGANSRQWMTAMQGMNRMSMVCVPLYETLGDSAVEFIITHAGARFVVSHASKLKLLVKAFASAKVRGVADVGVAYWGEAPADVVKSLEDQGVRVLPWDSLLQLGRDKEVAPVRPGAEDLCTIMYTSGTTGDPKGVMITHRAVVSMIAAIKAFLEQWNERIGPSDSYLSYLPLAHIFDRVVEELMIHVGGCVGYWQGDIRKLMDDVAALRPTIFAGVPRVFERVYNGIKEKLAHGSLLTRLIFQWAYARKEYYMKQGYKEKDASIISDLLVFKGVKAKLGGRVRVLVSGSAPLSTQMEAFMRVVVGAPFVQGYGLTETCAASFIASPDNFSHLGTVGAPMPATELRLEEVPELGYSPAADPPRGEVCIRGPAMFSGYYGQEALTKEAMDADGFFHTGDVGEITADGSLKIIDRKKNIFKLSQGEYVAVEKVENVYKTCPLVEQCWVYGDSLQPCLVGLVVPAEKPLMAWAAENGVAGDFKTVVASPAANAAVLKQMTDTGKAEKLNSLEQVKAVVLTTEQFTVENDLMTPSYKLKRAPLLKRYKREVDEMYTKMAEAVAHRAKTHAPAGAAH